MSLKIAILEDDPAQSQLVESWLEENYQCKAYLTGQSLLDDINTENFDILLIDWELPDINGPEVMHTIRNQLKMDTPIIFITSRDSESDIVNALNAGADDYLIKPLRQLEFLARIKSNSRRNLKSDSNDEPVTYPPYEFNPGNQQVTVNASNIELSSKEFELAYFLFKNEGQLLERKKILSAIWKQEADLNTRTVDTHISIIRKKLSIGPATGWRLKSVYGHGYRLERLN